MLVGVSILNGVADVMFVVIVNGQVVDALLFIPAAASLGPAPSNGDVMILVNW